MKKVILLFVMVCLSLNVSAQIQRSFFGHELGVATKAEIYESLKDKGAKIEILNGEETVCLNNARFGGYSWDMIAFFFYKNKFFQIVLFDFNSSNADKGKNIYNKLLSKYEKYVTSDKTGRCMFNDEKTIIFHMYEDGVTLGYSDVKLRNELDNQELDEF